LECTAQPDGIPEGTDLRFFSVEENTTDQITISAEFDGTIPEPVQGGDRGDVTLALDVYLFPDEDAQPYRIFVSSLFGPHAVQAGRVGGGFIDSSAFDLSVDGDTMEISFDPAVFNELPAGSSFPIGAETLVQEFADNSQNYGYQEIGSELCPEH
jgi:hypothetical protein